MGNPRVDCPSCGRTIGNNSIARHLRTHDPAHREAKRLGKNERQRAYAQTPDGKATTRNARRSAVGAASHRRRVVRHRQTEVGRMAHAAHAAVARALNRGDLVRLPCQRCGSDRVEAHHPNGYAPEHQLDVVWLCHADHMEAHDRVAA